MAPSKDSTTLAESLKKRKLDKTDLQEERRNRKKQKSKRKSLSENGDQTDAPATKSNAGSNSGNQDYVATDGQLVAQENTSGQLEVANSSWNVSKPIGGRMLNIDPVFSEDEV